MKRIQLKLYVCWIAIKLVCACLCFGVCMELQLLSLVYNASNSLYTLAQLKLKRTFAGVRFGIAWEMRIVIMFRVDVGRGTCIAGRRDQHAMATPADLPPASQGRRGDSRPAY